MHPFLILLIGMVIVIGGVLWLRLHAFLALILASLAVALLTPRDAMYEYEIRSNAVALIGTPGSDGTVRLAAGQADGAGVGTRYVVLQREAGQGHYRPVGWLGVTAAEANQSTARFVPDDPATTLDAEALVVHPMQERAAQSVAALSAGEQVATGFGRTCLSIGILIAMAAIIGKCLLDSGGATRIVRALRRSVGDERTPLAFLGSGFLIGIPVFFDTVFYLLIPLGKALGLQTGRNYLLYVLTIVAGATMAHSLVPPTPGPLFVAAALQVDLGLMILGGLAVGLFTITFGYAYALWANRTWTIPLRPSADITSADLDALQRQDDRTLPALWVSLLPILLPVVLIAGSTVFQSMTQGLASPPDWFGTAALVVNTLGDKNVALILAALVALIMLARQTRGQEGRLTPAVQVALASGGVIILITAAGGAFGHVLRLTGIATHLQTLIPATQAALLPLAFGLTALVRIAQGSATVAMITAVGIVAPLAAASALAFHPLYLALAIGCGSKPVPWMNDSGFWIISKMSGMTEGETLKTASVMMTLMGFVGLVVTMLGAWLFPLV